MSVGRTEPHRIVQVPIQSLSAEVVRGPDAGLRLQASGDTLSVGTAPGNDLRLTDETVSGYHLELRREADMIKVEDHGSTNGTTVAGVRLERAQIPAGTILTLGRTAVRVDGGAEVELELIDGDQVGPMRGRSKEMRRLMALVERVGGADASVLVLGETGAGKEVLARAIHQASRRAAGPFEVVDCGSIMSTLVASELFGHEKGAFTGADQRHAGAFERADGGTLFLDEVGELPAALQATLLGALERRSFRRVGGSSLVTVDVRVVAATNRDLRAEVNRGAFRQDLYYRLAVLLLRLPPLRDRIEDLPLLVDHFLEQLGAPEQKGKLFSPAALEAIGRYRWPGNVRELRNFVEASLVMGETAPLDADPDAPRTVDDEDRLPSVPLEELLDAPYKDARDRLLSDFERIYLKRLDAQTAGNNSEAARRAKVDRSYLAQLFRKHGLR